MKVVRYFFVGGIAALVDFGSFVFLIEVLRLGWFWAALIGFVLATAVNYLLSVRHVFESGIRFSRRHEIALVFLVSALGLLLNQTMLYLLIDQQALNVFVAKVLAMAVVFVWNFMARSRFVFSDRG